MVLVVGTDAYQDVAGADAYFLARGSNDSWDNADAAEKEGALRYASAWLDGKFNWRGVIAANVQVLGWPRFGATDDEGRLVSSVTIPQRIKDAAAEVALIHIDDPVNAPTGRETSAEKIGPIEVRYMESAAAKQTLDYVRLLLRGLTEGGTSTPEIFRA